MTLEQELTKEGFIQVPAISRREHSLEELYAQRDKFDGLYNMFRPRRHEKNIRNLLTFYETHIYLLDELIYQREQQQGDNK